MEIKYNENSKMYEVIFNGVVVFKSYIWLRCNDYIERINADKLIDDLNKFYDEEAEYLLNR
jgi:hypothetical protein